MDLKCKVFRTKSFHLPAKITGLIREIWGMGEFSFFFLFFGCLHSLNRCFFSHIQGFPQLLGTWEGALQNLMGGALSQYMGEHGGRLKILSKNDCDGVHLIVKLPPISLQVWKSTKNELLHTYFWRILARF